MYQKARIHGRDPAYDLSAEDDAVKKRRLHFGKCLREFLLDKYCMEGMSGADVAAISFFASEAGCLGVDDLSLRPELACKHGNEHVKLHAGKIWPDLDLQMIQCPMYDKREARRTTVRIPMYRPSTAFSNYITEEMIRMDTPESQYLFDKMLQSVDNYLEHPVVVRSYEEDFKTTVRPIALYWDGVAYTKHDSFMGFYVTDILSSQKFLSFLIRNFTFRLRVENGFTFQK